MRFLLIILIPLLLFNNTLNAKTKVLSGSAQVFDDAIVEEEPSHNHGADTIVEFGTKLINDTLYERKAFIKPEMLHFRNHASQVDSAHLVIFSAGGTGTTSSYFYLNRLLVNASFSGSENSGCPAGNAGMNYNAYYCLCDSTTAGECGIDSIAWNQVGCSGSGSDYHATVTDSFQLSNSIGDSTVIDITNDIKYFCDNPDLNYGWVLWSAVDSNDYRLIYTTDHTQTDLQPRVEIFYSTKRAVLVLNDTSSAAAIGVDSLLYIAMDQLLDYEVDYMTDADVAGYGTAYFDTAYDVVIWAGSEVAGPSPSSNANTIQASTVGWLSLFRWNYDENNLGIGQSQLQDDKYVVIDRQHWITRVLQDSLYMFMDGSVVTANMLFEPDSMHNIKPLIVDEGWTSDTGNVVMCAADIGDTVYNGDILIGRRVFLGLFRQATTQRDSCQFYTILNRAVAWAANDTNNFHVNHNACFSGLLEVEDAWVENSSGADSLESYGGWGSLYTGFDYDEKVAIMKISNDAIQRKLSYENVLIDDFNIRMQVAGVVNGTADSLWESTNVIQLVKLLWKCGREVGSISSDFVSWTYRYKDSSSSYPWNVGGILGVNSDVVDTVLDSIHQSRVNTGTDSIVNWNIPPEFAIRMIGDTTANHGWVWHNYWNNQVGELNDAEIIYRSSDTGDPRRKPMITVKLSKYWSGGAVQAVRRRTKIIGWGLIGD